MKLAEAHATSVALLAQMQPFTERIAIAGSIRREKPECTDIEIVAIARWDEVPDPSDLFGERTIRVNRLHEWALQSGIRWIHKANGEVNDATVKPDGRMWKGLLPCGAQLDLFITTPERWGTIFLIRTGSSDFSHAIMKHALRHNCQFEGGVLHLNGVPVETFEEESVFRHLQLQFVPPPQRIDGNALRRTVLP